MARREYIGGGRQGFQISPIDFLRGGGGEGNDVTQMAMALMGYGKGGPQDRAMEERQQQAEEMWRQGQLDISRRGEDRQEKAAAAELARQEAERQQHVAERTEDVSYRGKVFTAGEEEKAAERQRKEQDAALGTFEKAMDKGYLTDSTGKFTTLGEEWLKDLDPKAAERLMKTAKIQGEKAYQEKLKAYKALTPKQRKALEAPGSEAKIEELGGPEVYKRMVEETQQAQAKPNLTPGVSTAPPPPTQPYGAPPQQQEAPAYRYGTGTQVIPPVGGITEPITTGAYGTTAADVIPAPLYKEPYANEADITNRINVDPRFRPAEDIMMENLKNWWNQPKEPSVAAPKTVQAGVASYEMPRGQQVVNPEVYMPRTTAASAPTEGQPGFMDWLMDLVKSKSDQRDLPFTYGNVLPPSQPLPTPVQQRGDIYDILR